jgi:hypothetical protein
MSYVVMIIGILFVLGLRGFVNTYILMASCNYFLLLLGLTFLGKNRKAHASLMTITIVSDLALVFILEFKYRVIAETLSLKLSPFNWAHILSSLMAVILYFPAAVLGARMLFKGAETPQRVRLIHRKLGLLIVGFRTLGFFLMFSMQGLHPVQ